MNLFRSEEHVGNWVHYDPNSSEGIVTLGHLVQMYSVESMKHMLDGDYISRWQPLRGQEREELMDRLEVTSTYWRRPHVT